MDRMRRSGNSNSNQQTENLLESQNNQEVEHLRGKISQLKDVTVIINDTINSHNAMLDDMVGYTFVVDSVHFCLLFLVLLYCE
eukprot:m.22107 g.22107  ORF g.22107 m.22107 type:complete len:83 (+) comp8803_c0_seq1:25-273(+)